MSPPGSPGGFSMAPPLEPPSTVKPMPAGARAASDPQGVSEGQNAEPLLSPFLQRVAHQMQCDAQLLGIRHDHRKLEGTVEHRPSCDNQKAAQNQQSPEDYTKAATTANELAGAVLHSSNSLHGTHSHLQRDSHQEGAQGHFRPHLPAQGSFKEVCQPRCHPDLLDLESQQSRGTPAVRPSQHRQQPMHLLGPASHASQHPASASMRKPQARAGHADRGSAGSVQQQQHRQVRQQQHGSDAGQQHSPGSRQSIRQCHQHAAGLQSLSSGHDADMTPGSQQASNSLEAHSRHVRHLVRPAASLATQRTEAGSTIRHDARSGRGDSPIGHTPASEELPGCLDMSSTGVVEFPSESEASQRKKKKGSGSSPAGSVATSSGSSGASLDQRQLHGGQSMHEAASESIMAPLQLPSPLLDSNSEGALLLTQTFHRLPILDSTDIP